MPLLPEVHKSLRDAVAARAKRRWSPWRARHRAAVLLVGAVAVTAALTMLGLTRSTTQLAVKHAPAGIVQAPESESPYGKAAPDEYLDLKQSSASPVSAAEVARAQQQAAAVPAAASGIAWQQLGPYNIGGRIVDLVADKKTPNAVYAAASGGGIWHSVDGGANWTSVWPNENVQTMGSLAEDSNGTLWAGTGEANPPGGGLTYFGDGIYKSTDGGAHWTNMGLTDSAAIGRIAIDPTNPNIVFAAATGNVTRSVSQRGLYRTTDGGQTWKLVLTPTTSMTGAVDVAINPANPKMILASLWDHKRNNGARVYGGLGSGLFKSIDGGDTWTRLQNIVDPLPAYDQKQTGLTQDASLGRIGMAFAPSDPKRVYVVTGSPYGPDKGFYWSDDDGDSFHVGAQAYGGTSGYQWWFGRIWVDPENEDHIFNADVSLRTSTNHGMTWTNDNSGAPGQPGIHSDHHAMDWDPSTVDGNPATPERVFEGNDGGIYRSENGGVNGSWFKATNQPWNQSYHLAVSQQDSQRLSTGLQDNGSNRTWTAAIPHPTDPTLAAWNSDGGGDGHVNVIDPVDQTWYYTCFQPSPPNQSCQSLHDVGTTTTTRSLSNTKATPAAPTAGWPTDQRWTTDTPITIDPNNDAVIYLGGTVLGRSPDHGVTFSMISPDDPGSLPGPVPPDENDLGPFYANEYATISAIAPAKEATTVPYANTIYVGTDTGMVWKTDDAGGHWTHLTNGLPTRWVNAIVVDPADKNHVYVAFSGYREGDTAANVYESHDGGATWTNISQNLPNGPVEEISYDDVNNVMFAATDVGVFDHKDGDSAWYKVSVGLPNVPVLDVKLSGDHKFLFAATFGRSVWKLPLSVDATDGGGTGGTVPATLGLTLGTSASFGPFTPGVAQDYNASTTANVISTAGDATLSVSDASATAPGHLVNGTFSLPSALQAKASSGAGTGGAFAPISATPIALLTYSAPVSNDSVTLSFLQHIGSTDALRTGSYTKTMTFTLSTTTP